MTTPTTPPRPRQVTLAATLIMGGSVVVDRGAEGLVLRVG